MSLDSFNAWMAASPEWLGLAIFLIAFLECAAIVGIVLPGVVLLFGVAVIAGSGALGLGETLLLAYAGGVLGDLSSYWIGRRFHQNIRRLPGLRSHPQWITAAEVYFERYGIASLLVGRFIGALRPMLPMVAGMLDMPFGRFRRFADCRRRLGGRLPVARLGYRRSPAPAVAGRLLERSRDRRGSAWRCWSAW